MIEIRSLKPDAARLPTTLEIYRGPETEAAPSRWPTVIMLAITAVAIYLKSLFPGLARSDLGPPSENQVVDEAGEGQVRQSRAEDDLPGTEKQAEDETGSLGDKAAETDQAIGTGGPGPTVSGIADFMGIDSPPIDYELLPLPRHAPTAFEIGFGRGRAGNDNLVDASLGGSGSSGDGGTAVVPNIPVVVGPFRPVIVTPDPGPGDDDNLPEVPEPPVQRNRAPRVMGPVSLGDIGICQAFTITLAALLAGASDADADTLGVVDLRASSGTLVAIEGGWQFTPTAGYYGPVTFSYAISDGEDIVVQSASLKVVEFVELIGTDGNDDLVGTECADLIDGRDGNDTIDARGGNDIVHGSGGADIIRGGAGHDLIYAGRGNDIVYGGAGNDTIHGGEGNDQLFGEDGDDIIFGGDGNDVIFGEAGNDQLSGGAGDDIIDGGEGDDEIDGGEGDDIIDAGAGNDAASGGDGDDIMLMGDGADTANGGDDNDTLFGHAGNDHLAGGNGRDHLDGGDGDDIIDGGEGDDTALGGAGNDIMVAGTGNDDFRGGEGNDGMLGGDGNDRLDGEAGDDVMSGDDGDDCMIGGAGNDTMHGGAGNDTMSGGDGNDTLADGAGRDNVDGGNGNDRVIAALDGEDDCYDGGEGRDTLDLSQAQCDVDIDLVRGRAIGIEIGDDRVFDFEEIIGGAGDDHFTVGAQAMTLKGGAGDDTFTFDVSCDDDDRELIHDILDFEAGDRIVVKQYQIRSDDDDDDDDDRRGGDDDDRFERNYGDGDDDGQPFRFRIEKIGEHERTYVDVYIEQQDEKDFSIEILGSHRLYYW